MTDRQRQRTIAYMKANEIMLSFPEHTAHEGKTSYILSQIVDCGDQIAIQVLLVDPGVPEKGDAATLETLNDAQKTAVASLSGVANAIKAGHEKVKAMRRPKLGHLKDKLESIFGGLDSKDSDLS